jgi:hypothetical protein
MTSDTVLKLQDPLWGILLRLAINIGVLYILIYLIYPRFSRKKDFMFPLFLMGIMLFLICILLKKSEMQMGMALGLFAVFSIMRFRTENLVSKNMAYLFTVIGASVINAMFDFPHPVRGTILVNIIIILTVLILELTLSKYNIEAEDKAERLAEMKAGNKTAKKTEMKPEKNHDDKKFNKHEVLYDNLKLLNPDKKDALLRDISKRTGIEAVKVRIRRIDLIKSNAVLDVYYRKKKSEDAEI